MWHALRRFDYDVTWWRILLTTEKEICQQNDFGGRNALVELRQYKYANKHYPLHSVVVTVPMLSVYRMNFKNVKQSTKCMDRCTLTIKQDDLLDKESNYIVGHVITRYRTEESISNPKGISIARWIQCKLWHSHSMWRHCIERIYFEIKKYNYLFFF